MNTIKGARIHISGIVQGVGFRPFIYSLAIRLGLKGWVRNTSAGVDIEMDGTSETLEQFSTALRDEPPPLAHIDSIKFEPIAPQGFTAFEIIRSESIEGAFIPISPDVSICPDCLRELFDPVDRRYRYPFINCTNCGPRFTIIEDIPYDRLKTTMKGFPMCPACAVEYTNPLDRRFHAQPVACPVCGPKVWLEYPSTDFAVEGETDSEPASLDSKWYSSGDAAIHDAQILLANGKIIAIKGLGGFHLACDATNLESVIELRRRKLRVDKPFALMMADLNVVEQHCFLNAAERKLLKARERPIVILNRRPESTIAPEVVPGQDTIGVMLPYTPLHYLIFHADRRLSDNKELQPSGVRDIPTVLVMTSGNLSEEPIATRNHEARMRLTGLADAYLMHNRPIRTRCDDSVTRIVSPSKRKSRFTMPVSTASHQSPPIMFLRRGRGYAPDPIRLPCEARPILATGAELKNTFCLTRGHYAFLSHHIGDLENFETLNSFEDGITHFERLFRIKPEAIAYDLHPNYLATRYALERAEREGLPAIEIQHHHAHIAACMADNGLDGLHPVIGVAFDGTGYGADRAIWGGEFLIADYAGYQRVAHLAYMPLPGGDTAIRQPARIALAYLWQLGLDWDPNLAPVKSLSVEELSTLRSMLKHQINSPFTSSMGRLFDAAAALTGVRQKVNYEAQAAIEFEALVDPDETRSYPFEIDHDNQLSVSEQTTSTSELISPTSIDPTPMFQAMLVDLQADLPTPQIAARFHNGIAEMVFQVAVDIRSQRNISGIALSGGVWQNTTLLQKTVKLLEKAGVTVYTHIHVPPNDGGLALGQAMIANERLSSFV